MPLPKPRKGEARDKFVERCMSSEAAKEFPTDENGKNQRLAVCEKQYDEHKSTATLPFDERHLGALALQALVVRTDTTPDALPKGVCARITGVALTYNVTDDYGTRFAPGCLTQTIAEKVRTGKVRLFADHDARTKTHIGTVIDIRDVGDTAIMTADFLDTEAGHRMKEYVEAVLDAGKATGATTGLSVGFRCRESETMTYTDDDGKEQWAILFKEIELREISITPVPAVPGTEILSIRRERAEDDQGLLKRMLARILSAVPESEARAVFDTAYASAADKSDKGASSAGATPVPVAPNAETQSESSTASATPVAATLEERRKILRDICGAAAGT